MANINSIVQKTCVKPDFESRMRVQWKVLGSIFMGMFMLYPPTAMAALEAQGLCEFASYLKIIATTAAIIALMLFVINSFFIKSSVIGDIILYVIIGCVIIAGGTEVIDLTGLTSTCQL